MKCRFSRRKQIICFILGLAICGLGVGLSTRPLLGSTPISSVPYVVNSIAPFLSMGMWTIVYCAVLVAGQMCMPKHDPWKILLLQMVASFGFGFFIDLGMWVTSFYLPESYMLRIGEQLLGCFVLAVGIIFQISAMLVYLPGEGFVATWSNWTKMSFGSSKILFDFTMITLALLISLCFRGELWGVREGTLLTALSVGVFIKILHPQTRNLKLLLVKGISRNWLE